MASNEHAAGDTGMRGMEVPPFGPPSKGQPIVPYEFPPSEYFETTEEKHRQQMTAGIDAIIGLLTKIETHLRHIRKDATE